MIVVRAKGFAWPGKLKKYLKATPQAFGLFGARGGDCRRGRPVRTPGMTIEKAQTDWALSMVQLN
jgi:hypothetical protein